MARSCCSSYNTCHAVSGNYNSSTHSIGGTAVFLPFDVPSFRFSSAVTRSAQEDAFRRLNEFVLEAEPTTGVSDLVNGAYGGAVGTAGTQWNDDYVPSAWVGTSTEANRSLYAGVVRPSCRTCHVSASNTSIDFGQYADFSARKETIKSFACTSGAAVFMPHAEHVMRKFWSSGGRAYLDLWTGGTTGCRP